MLVGRDGELQQLSATVTAAAGGVQRAVVLLGEAGIGKSALLGAARAYAADAGMLVLHGVGAEHEREVPFSTVVDALDDHVATVHARRIESLGPDREAELAEVLPSIAREARSARPVGGAAERFRYHRALRSLIDLLTHERPVALVIDDLHWVDEASVEFVLHLLRRPLDAPLLLVIASRPNASADAVLDAMRQAGPAAELIRVPPLTPEHAGRLLGALRDETTRRRVIDDAAGNPLFLLELAKVSDAILPRTLVAAVRLELQALDGGPRSLIDGAAVAGDPFDLGLAAVAAGLSETDAAAALEPLVAADLVRTDGPQLRFRHPVIRRSVYEAVPAGARLLAHARANDELRRRGAGSVLRAYHVAGFALPGNTEAVELLADAAATVRARAPSAAAHWYEAAVRLLDPQAKERLALQFGLADALADAGSLEAAHGVLLGVLDDWPRDDPVGFGRLTAACAGLELVLGRHAQSQRRLERAIGDLPADAPAAVRAELTLELGGAAGHREDIATVSAVAGEASRLVGEEDAALWVADQALVAHAASYRGDVALAAEACTRATERFDTLEDAEIASRPVAAYYLGWAQIHLMRLADAVTTTTRGLDIVRRAQQGRWLPHLAALTAIAHYNRGEVDLTMEALEIAEDSARLQGLSNPLCWTLWMQAATWDLRGDDAAALRRGDECLHVAAALEDSGLERQARCAIALVHVWGDPARCLREIKDAAGADVDLMEPQRSTRILRVMVEAAIAVDDLTEARRCAELLEDRARTLGLEICDARARTARAALLLAEGDAGAAVAAARDAAETAARFDVVVDELAAELVLGRALAAAGTREEAGTQLRKLDEQAAALGAHRYADAASRELRRLGMRSSTRARRARAGSDDTPAREREVTELAVAGRSNKEIAAMLFVSVKTVEHHLSNAFVRAGVRSRVELARTWAPDGEPA